MKINELKRSQIDPILLYPLTKQKRHELNPDNHATLDEIKIGTVPVISVKSTAKAIDVFRLMDNKKLTGVAVVDETGKLVGNTSASDLKVNFSKKQI